MAQVVRKYSDYELDSSVKIRYQEKLSRLGENIDDLIQAVNRQHARNRVPRHI